MAPARPPSPDGGRARRGRLKRPRHLCTHRLARRGGGQGRPTTAGLFPPRGGYFLRRDPVASTSRRHCSSYSVGSGTVATFGETLSSQPVLALISSTLEKGK